MTGPMLTTSWRRGPTSSRYHPQDRRPDGDSGSWWQPALWARQRGGDWQPPGKAWTFEADAGSERRNEGERTTLESWRWGYTPEVAEAVSGSRFRLGPGLEAEAIIAGSGSRDVWVVPGNPGTAGYYAVFVNALHEKLPDTRIICCSYRGHAFRKDLEGNGGVYSLEEQMRHQKLLLTHFRGPDAPQKPLVLVGHSIGAHMCLELNRWLVARPPPASTPSRGPGLSEAQAVVGIAPFLQLYKRPLSTFLTVSMLTWVATPMRALADAIVWLLPVAMRRWMFGAASGLHEAWAVGLLGDHLDGHQVTNTLAMGRTELAALDKPVDWSEQQRLGRRLLHVFGRDDDYWAPLALRRSAQQQLPQAHIRHLPDMQHAFCTTLLEAQLVAENVAQFVSQVMPQPRSSSAVAADAAAPGC